jgi:hypothetical protein
MKRKYFTKAEALTMFKQEVGVVADDAPMNRENWNVYVWHLYQCKHVSRKQYDTWANPF